jgi:hypothetical protein
MTASVAIPMFIIARFVSSLIVIYAQHLLTIVDHGVWHRRSSNACATLPERSQSP